MPIDRSDFEQIGEADLEELVTGGVPEGMRLDLKVAPYGNSDADKREFLKDVSSFANSQGGHLLIGVDENAGVASAIPGIGGINVDQELLRLEQIARTGIEPRITGLRMRAIRLASSNQVLVVRVLRNWGLPHRVIAQGVNRFYLRHSTGVHEASMEELRALFTQASSALELARAFRDSRLEYICSGRSPRRLASEGRFIFHIVPAAGLVGAVNLDVEQIFSRHREFAPMGQMGLTPSFNFHGLINESGGEPLRAYTQVFRNGAVECVLSEIVRQNKETPIAIPGLAVERYFFKDVLSKYIFGLRDLGVPTPLILMITLEGVSGVTYATRLQEFQSLNPSTPLADEVLKLPECVLEDYGTEIENHRAIRPAFNALWNAIGFAKSTWFDDQGKWVGPK